MRTQRMIKISESMHPEQLDKVKLFATQHPAENFEEVTPEDIRELDDYIKNKAAVVSASKRRVGKAEVKALK